MNPGFRRCLENGKIVPFERGKELVRKEINVSESDLSDAMTGYSSQRYKWSTIQAYYAMFHAARAQAAPDSYFLIDCDVYSSAVFTVDIGKTIDGHLRYKSQRNDGELEKEPEITSPLIGLERSVTWHLRIRQWVSSSMMNTIALDGGEEVTLVFNSVNVWVNAKYPDGSDGLKCRLPLPLEFQVRLATRSEIVNQPTSDKGGSQP